MESNMIERRREWLRRFEEELMLQSDHPYDLRYLAICWDIVNKMADPAYEPPTFEEVMKDAPWGP